MKSHKRVSNPNEAGASRRSFFKRAGTLAGATVVAGSGAMMLASAPKAQAVPAQDIDPDILNFALNLEYLEAEFYLRGVYGDNGLDSRVDVTGSGTPGVVIIKDTPGVPFKTVAIKEYALEIAQHEQQHVQFLRDALTAAGVQPIARPTIEVRDSFNLLAQAAGLGETFDPFISEENFVLASYIFEDVGVTAYSGASTLLTNPAYLQAAAKILSVEAYHGGILRLLNFQAGFATQVAADKISNTRAVLGGGNDAGILNGNGFSQLVPVDGTSLAFARTAREVLNVVYGAVGATAGGFFPNGVNGAINGFTAT